MDKLFDALATLISIAIGALAKGDTIILLAVRPLFPPAYPRSTTTP